MRFLILGSIIAVLWSQPLGRAYASQDSPPQIGTDVGKMYPDFLLPTLDGKTGRLSDYRGKKVLLINFASW